MEETTETGARSMFAKPLLRGWLHALFFAGSIPAGIVIVLRAEGDRSHVATAVYALGCCALFGVSAAYHLFRWSPAARRRMQRADHATIFVMIAGSYTPLCLLAFRGSGGTLLLILAWLGAATGVTLVLTGVAQRRKVIGSTAYIALGWLLAAFTPTLVRQLSTPDVILIAAGGVAYTLGALVFAIHWPNPSPRFFGYHEVWHTFVAAAAICHYIAITGVVRAA